MRRLLLAALSVAGCAAGAGRQDRVAVPAPSLAGSLIPNAPVQPALVLLPRGYREGGAHYPVAYVLPGFTTDIDELVDGSYEGLQLGRARDRAAPRLIVVVVNGRNALGGSFYVNSPVTGRWEDHVIDDVIPFIEAHYRVARRPGCRAIVGHSMGGTGALLLAMRHPGMFAAVAAISPGLFDEHGLEDEGMLSPPYRAAWSFDVPRMRRRGADWVGFFDELYASSGAFGYRRAFAYAYGAAFSPAPDAGPPFVDPTRIDRYRAGYGDLAAKVARHERALRGLGGILLDVDHEDRPWRVRGARRFSALLDEHHIPHRLVEHEAGHGDRLGERFEHAVLPFVAGHVCAAGPAT